MKGETKVTFQGRNEANTYGHRPTLGGKFQCIADEISNDLKRMGKVGDSVWVRVWVDSKYDGQGKRWRLSSIHCGVV